MSGNLKHNDIPIEQSHFKSVRGKGKIFLRLREKLHGIVKAGKEPVLIQRLQQVIKSVYRKGIAHMIFARG